jgi:hypothetical protein
MGHVGALNLKAEQDLQLQHQDRYIRRIIEESGHFDQHEEDIVSESAASENLRIVVCMSAEGSRRLLKTQYVQSDIGFKRVVGFYEFELAGMDRDANISMRVHSFTGIGTHGLLRCNVLSHISEPPNCCRTPETL